jgi:hypothetical protein
MKQFLLPLALLFSIAAQVAAQTPAAALPPAGSTDVYLCVDDKGHREYKNTGVLKGCKKVDLPSITTVPAPPKHANGGGAAKPANAGPSEFPKVDSATQKARDNDRKQILQDELKSEQQKLDSLKKDFHGGEPERQGGEANYAKYQERVAKMKDDIERVSKNVDALNRELSNLK